MRYGIILSGIGGQGIVLMGRYLGLAAMKHGCKVTVAPAYGQEKRGSYVHCQVSIGDELCSPVISAADSVFVMDDDSFDLYEKTVKTGGKMILNQDSITRSFSRNDIDYIQLPLAELAIQAGSIKCANMVGLGALAQGSQVIQREDVLELIQKQMKPALVEMNQKAFDLGYRFKKE